MSNWGFNTKQIHVGQQADPVTGAQTVPIYQTNAFVFPSAEEAAARFALTSAGNIYTRLHNPTNEVPEARLAALEGGTAAALVSSGQSATFYSLLNLASAGDHIVTSQSLYGGTFNMFKITLARLGIEIEFVDADAPDAWRRAVRPNTKAFFGESIPNPQGDVLDIEAIAEVAREANVPLIVDNTIATPYLLRPFEYGANYVVHSATKFLGGHGNSMGGVIVENGSFDFMDPKVAGKYPGFQEPDESYHGVTFGPLGDTAFITRVRTVLMRDIGAVISPFNSFLINLGLETLSLRMERHVQNTAKVVDYVAAQPGVTKISWASHPDSKYYELAKKYTPKGAGAVFTFDLPGGREAGRKFVDALELHSNVANIGDVRSLVIHPASTTHSQMTEEELEASGIRGGTVRLCVGLEDVEDIIADLAKGFAAAQS